MAYKDVEFIKYCRNAMQKFMKQTKGISLVSLSSIDGFEIVTECAMHPDVSSMRLSAMGSSLLALSSGVCRELELNNINFLEINTEDGFIFTASAFIKDKELVILIQTDQNALQGELIYHGKQLVKKISEFMH